MVASYSQRRETGGTLHLPSPTSLHNVNPSSAINQLRRTLSRSPSRGNDFRFFSNRTRSPKHSSFLSSLSPSRRSMQPSLVVVPQQPQSPLAVPYPPSARIKSTLRRTQSAHLAKLGLPLSPTRRVLKDSRDLGNSVSSQLVTTDDQNITNAHPRSQFIDGPLKSSAAERSLNQNFENKSHTSFPAVKPEKRRNTNLGLFPASTSSPMKRSDEVMNLDQIGAENSPSVKRRSLHCTNFGSDFDIFECETATRDKAAPDSAPSHCPEPQSPTWSPSAFRASIPKRAHSLRKSTLQQRQPDRPISSRAKQAEHGECAPISPKVLRSRQRAALDSQIFLPPQGNVTTPSLFSGTPSQPAAHPLSRTITQSSSGSSLDDSPTHEPVQPNPFLGSKPRPILNFSKSLPVGSRRPAEPAQLYNENSKGSTDGPFATPVNYKLVKPLPAAFMSTGLISKKNRDAEDSYHWNASKNMPDTPCKRPVNLFNLQKNSRSTVPGRSKPRSSLSSIWTASAASDKPAATTPHPGPFSKGMDRIGSSGDSFVKPSFLSRRGSFVSADDGDDGYQSHSPSSSKLASQPTLDSELPPTPTKQASIFAQPTRSSMSPEALGLNSNRSRGNSSPLGAKSGQSTSPHTPLDGTFPDPGSFYLPMRDSQDPGKQTSFVPATPTAPRETFLGHSKRFSLPLTAFDAPDIDPTLSARFDKIDLIGTGEFSQVYRVGKQSDPIDPHSLFAFQPKPKSVISGKVWAVKKSKHPFSGIKDRERRMQEVQVLGSLGNSEHIISYVDSWEDCGYLYIQTEFCEEGSLETFLATAGLKARLDDFRIWKILLELASGLKHIHDSGFIHLDLKPANVLITFEGVLKIADFGMACTWPAESWIEGEGDREYIGPEILMGRFDKPADIFALGLIVFETAGNVQLPDNGVSWQKLRNGDMSDIPSLTWSTDASTHRDESGNPLSDEVSFEELTSADGIAGDENLPFMYHTFDHRPKPHLIRSGELADPPEFMVNATHESALDAIVRWMIAPDPIGRPTAAQVLNTQGVEWVERRRRAGATIYEGNWGPADEVLLEDAEMIDV